MTVGTFCVVVIPLCTDHIAAQNLTDDLTAAVTVARLIACIVNLCSLITALTVPFCFSHFVFGFIENTNSFVAKSDKLILLQQRAFVTVLQSLQ